MRRTAALRWSAALLLLLGGCGSDSSKSDASGAPQDVSNLTDPGFDLSGGSAKGPAGSGGEGGVFTSRSDRAFKVSSDAAPAPPTLLTPAVVNEVTDLDTDRVFNGTTELK